MVNKVYRVSYNKFNDHFTTLEAAWKGAKDAGPFWSNTVFRIYEAEFHDDPKNVVLNDLVWNLKFEVNYAPKQETTEKSYKKTSDPPKSPSKPKNKLELAFEVMQLDIHDNYATVKSQFRKLAKQTHPDMGGNEEQFRKINDAYQYILSAKGW